MRHPEFKDRTIWGVFEDDARTAGRMVLVRSHAERPAALLGEEVVAGHPRCFQRDMIVYDSWRYLPVLMKKPGACATALRSRTGICRSR